MEFANTLAGFFQLSGARKMLSAATATSVGQLQVGMKVHILHVPKTIIPLSASVLDPAVYPVCERAMGIELARYALEGVNAKP